MPEVGSAVTRVAQGLAWIAPADRCAEVLKRGIKRNGAARVSKQQALTAPRCVDDAIVRAMIRARLEGAIT